jgi:hypothetical protein
VTVLTLQAEALHVMLVAKRDWLIGALALAGNPWRPLQLIQRYSQGDNDQSR